MLQKLKLSNLKTYLNTLRKLEENQISIFTDAKPYLSCLRLKEKDHQAVAVMEVAVAADMEVVEAAVATVDVAAVDMEAAVEAEVVMVVVEEVVVDTVEAVEEEASEEEAAVDIDHRYLSVHTTNEILSFIP